MSFVSFGLIFEIIPSDVDGQVISFALKHEIVREDADRQVEQEIGEIQRIRFGNHSPIFSQSMLEILLFFY